MKQKGPRKRPYYGGGMRKGYKTAKVRAREDATKKFLKTNAEKVLAEISKLAFSDVRALFDEKGNLRPVHDLSDYAAPSIAGLEVVKRNITTGDGAVDTIHKVKVWDKTKALEMLAKHFSLLTEKVDVTVTGTGLLDKLAAGRARVASGQRS